MVDSDGDGIYECEVAKTMTNIIFCRMNPAYTELSWDSKWNQTVDLTIGEAPTNYFYFTDWGNEQTEGKSIGEWRGPKVYTSTQTEEYGVGAWEW